MINLPNGHELKELTTFKEPFCLSVYVPFIKPSVATNPNRILLKNLLREAKIALSSAGVKSRDVQKTLRPAHELLKDHEFWPVHHASIALFMHPKIFRYYHIPDHRTPYLLTVERGFNLEPLQKVMQRNRPYFILTLGHKNIKLYAGDRYSLKAVHLNDFPSDMKDVLNIDEYPNWRETHAIAPTYTGKGSEAYHGQYNVSQTDKKMLLEFFQRIDHRLHSFLLKKSTPLIVAGVNYLIPIYQKANTYPHLLSRSLTGNFERTNLDSVRKRAWRLIESETLP